MTLKDYLKKNNITGYAFSREVGVSLSYMYRLIESQRRPSVTVAVMIEKATGGQVTPSDFARVTNQ